MKKFVFVLTMTVVLTGFTKNLWAQDQEASAQKVKPPDSAAQTIAEKDISKKEATETTANSCTDGMDNDNDGRIDCADDGCQIFAVCVAGHIPSHAGTSETGLLCRDNIDNNQDGKTDCEEMSCQGTHYCQVRMYDRPLAPKSKAPGFFVSLGGGATTPNYISGAKEFSVGGRDVGFEPGIGGIGYLTLGIMPTKWLGLGMTWSKGKTNVSNRYDILGAASDDDYRYKGHKRYSSSAAFLRLQAPLGRVVPYLEGSAAYTKSRTRLEVYDANNRWADIEDWYNDPDEDRSNLIGTASIKRDAVRQFAAHASLGLDVYVVEQMFAIGAKFSVPIWASDDVKQEPMMGLLTMTLTPKWREKKQLKQKYAPK